MLTELRTLAGRSLKALGLNEAELVPTMESPRRPNQGQLALPVFQLAKSKGMAPPVLATELALKLNAQQIPEIERVEAVQGFVNFHFQTKFLQELLLNTLRAQGSEFGRSTNGLGKTLVIDFSSPNVAKAMHIGHLRATVIGQAIVNLARSQGYKVIGLNHLGDWGVQFGNLAWAYKHWASEYPFDSEPFASLTRLYIRFHEEAEKDPELARKGAETFRRLEEGDSEITQIWKLVVEISLREYARIWKMLGVAHDLVRGESYYNDRLKPVENLLESRGLLVESDGAMVVRLDDEGMAPCLIRKTDGASLYATRDLASAIYRHDELGADLNLYVVGAEQTLHFRQIFSVLKKLGYAWAANCHHIGFGMYRFKDIGKMSSRKGNVILLEDVLSRAIEMVKAIIGQKNPNLAGAEKVAQQVGIGAIVFNDLMNDRNKNVEFDWEKVLDFEGDSGPYVQYCHVRCVSLVNKFGKPCPTTMKLALESLEERELIRALINFPDVLQSAFKNFKPHLVATYLLEICKLFSQFYTQHRILGEESSLEESRMALVGATQAVLARGLGVLNIEAPNAM
jgi:arginyl-tRNA synthetase